MWTHIHYFSWIFLSPCFRFTLQLVHFLDFLFPSSFQNWNFLRVNKEYPLKYLKVPLGAPVFVNHWLRASRRSTHITHLTFLIKYILGQRSSAQTPKTEHLWHKGYESQVMTFCHMHYSDSLPCHPVSLPGSINRWMFRDQRAILKEALSSEEL